jgi:hypothetical protein
MLLLMKMVVFCYASVQSTHVRQAESRARVERRPCVF